MNRKTTVIGLGTVSLLAATALTGLATATPAAAHITERSAPPPLGKVITSGPFRLDPGVHLTPTHLPHASRVSAGLLSSSNWAGYAVDADSGRVITHIQDLFSVPSINCANSTIGTSGFAYVADWAGLDGLFTSTVEQDGVDAYCTSTSSPPVYFAWYEMYPDAPVTISGVDPGDAIISIVTRVSTGWQLTVEDRTNGGSFTTVQPCPAGSSCSDASAEVITEDPGGAVAGGVDLADFGLDNQTDIAISDAHTSGNLDASSAWVSDELGMYNGSDHMAGPGDLYGGAAFYAEWLASS
jgi:hypothetical protein